MAMTASFWPFLKNIQNKEETARVGMRIIVEMHRAEHIFGLERGNRAARCG